MGRAFRLHHHRTSSCCVPLSSPFSAAQEFRRDAKCARRGLDPPAPKTEVCGSALQLVDMRLTVKLFARFRWARSLGSWLFDTWLLDVLTGLALIAVALKLQRFIDDGAITFWLLLCFEH